jgi:glycosyltransferase involved in cell wall biosynthesis
MTHYRRCFQDTPCLVDEHNVEHRIIERCGSVERFWPKQQLYFQQASKMRRFEANAIRNFSACTVVSDDDADVLKELTNDAVPIHVLANGVDTEFFSTNFDGELSRNEEDAVVYTGSMDWMPNEDAVLYFIKDILPLIWKENPKVKFYVVGKGPSAALVEIGKSEPRIIVTDRVDDVRPYMARAKVFVTPLRIGGGTRIKILEAMSMEKAIISTSIGAEGIDYIDEKNIMIADRPQEFAKKVLLLLSAPQKRKELGKAGRQLVLGSYDWSIMGRQLRGLYEGLING